MQRWLAAVVVLAACERPQVLSHVEALDFGDVRRGETKTLTLFVTGDGRASLTHDDGPFTLSTSAFASPGEVQVTFTPDRLGPVELELRVQGPAGVTLVRLRGRGVGAALGAPDEVLLGRLLVVRGEPARSVPVPLRVQNDGTRGSTLSVTARSDDAELCVGDACAAWTASIAAGEALEVPLAVRPSLAGERAWTLTLSSDDAAVPTRTVVVRAVVEVFEPCRLQTPTSLVIPVATAARLDVTHAGPGRCFLRDVTVTSSPDVMVFDVPPTLPLELDAGETKTLWLKTLRPRPQQAQGTVTLVPAGAPAIDISVTLEPVIQSGCLVMAPDVVDFGAVPQGCRSLTRSVSIYNTCSQPIALEPAALTSGAQFHLVGTYPTHAPLEPGAVPARVELRFVAGSLGPATDALRVRAAGVDYVVGLQGRSEPPSRHSDSFRDDVLPRADLLVMTDTSPSFAAKLPTVRANLAAMLSGRLTQCADLRVAFAPAEGAVDAGVAFSLNDAGEPWTSNQAPDFVARALGAFDALPVSSETEACIGPASQLVQSGVRADAGVAGLCITDALEQTPNPQAALATFAAGHQLATWSVVAALPASSCSVESVDDGVHDALTQTGLGILADVCDADWAAHFEPLVGGTCGQRLTFFLSSMPFSPASIEVLADGLPLPSTAWSWNPASNTIEFTAATVPPRGALITVNYDASCE